MRIGIVGAEAAKFTPETEAAARLVIRDLLRGADTVVSGGCHLGGIDIWAKEEAKKCGVKVVEYLPSKRAWPAYRLRNIKIAENSDQVVCIVVRTLPPGFKGIRFGQCYHCHTTDHVKSGGCWTANYAARLGKPTQIIIIGE